MRRTIISAFLLLIASVTLSTHAQERVTTEQTQQNSTRKITINLKNVTAREIIYELRRQSGVNILFEDRVLAKIPAKSITLKDVSIEKALDELLKGTELTYKSSSKGISIIQKPAPAAQSTSGSVVDASGAPIVGASITLVGTTLGTATDGSGRFSIKVAKGQSIQFSYLGMKSKVVVYNGEQTLNIVMQEDVAQVDEVIVTGMFTRKAESFTGSAKTITANELQRVGNGNIFQSLRNIDPSLNIIDNMENGSDPNKLPSMQLRGTSTYNIEGASSDLKSNYQNDPNQPLFILDGFEVSATKIFDLDMNRVQSLTILKDASAKAIYGSKAANGVIVIETKRNTQGEFHLTYKGSVDVTMPDLSSYDLCNAFEKLEVEKIAGVYESNDISSLLSNQALYNQRMKAALEGINTDWLSKPLHTGIGTKHAVSIEMGEQKVRTIVDLSYNNISGVMKGSSRNVLSASLNNSYRVSHKILFRNIMSITSNKSKSSPYGSFSEYAAMNPYFSPYDEEGNITSENKNPLYNATLNTKITSDYLEFSDNLYVEYNITDDLKTVAKFSVTTQRSAADEFYPANHTRFTDYTTENFFRRGSYQQNVGQHNNLNGEITFQYNKAVGKSLFIANGAFSISQNKSNETVHYAEGFPSDRMDDITFALQYAQSRKPYGYESIWRDAGFTFVGGYTYDNRFLADFTLRENASSQFGTNNRWGTFWSLGLGWNIHNEPWAKNMEWLDQFKLRASLGTTGSQGFSSYQAITTYKYYTNRSYAGDLGAYIIRLANEDLKWQQKLDYNVGFDARIGKLSMTFDLYRSYTDDLITDLSLPTSTGYSSVKENMGKIRNQGVELSANYRLYSGKKGFLNISASITTNNNKIIKLSDAMRAYNQHQDELVSSRLDGGRSKPVLRYIEGESLNSIWAIPSLGVNPQNGREVYVMPDGNTTYDWKSEYQQSLGNSQEKYRGTFGFNGEYRGFGLGVICRYLGGGQYYNQTLVDKVENCDINGNVDKRVLYGRWSPKNPYAPFKTLARYNDENGNYITIARTQPTSRFVQDRNELTISSVNAYYQFDRKEWMKRIGMQRMKIAFNMNDIYTFSTIKMERGTSYPFARSMSFSLTAEF